MKKLTIVALLAAIILVGCNEAEPDESNEAVESEQEVQTEEPDPSAQDSSEEQELPEVTDIEEDMEQTSVTPQYYVAEDASLVPLEEGVNENVVLLTVDDAPSTYTMEMAETLEELEAGAIFFVNGHFLDTPEEEEMLKELHEMGFLIGNHTFNHPLLSDIPEEEQREEIVSLNDRVEEIIGERPKFFRAPNGVNTDYSEQVVAEEDMVLMNWTYGYDYFEPYMDADKLATAMITGEGPEVDVPNSLLKPGANLLMHDREWTNEALGEIVTGLREEGYEIVDPALIQVTDE